MIIRFERTKRGPLPGVHNPEQSALTRFIQYDTYSGVTSWIGWDGELLSQADGKDGFKHEDSFRLWQQNYSDSWKPAPIDPDMVLDEGL